MSEWPERGLPGKAVQSRKRGITAGAASPMNEPTDNKHTMKKELLFVGLDVHAQSITLALAEGGGAVDADDQPHPGGGRADGAEAGATSSGWWAIEGRTLNVEG